MKFEPNSDGLRVLDTSGKGNFTEALDKVLSGEPSAGTTVDNGALFIPSLESSVTKEGLSAAKEAGEHEAASEKAVTEEVNKADNGLPIPSPLRGLI